VRDPALEEVDREESPFARSGVTPDEELEELAETFWKVWEARPGNRHERWFTFADAPCRFRIVGSGLAGDVFRAFAHLEEAPSPKAPALDIHLWDGQETGFPLEGVEPLEDLNAQGETFVSRDNRVILTARPQIRTGYHRLDHVLFGWVNTHTKLTQYELGRPLHTELMLWHKDRDVQAIHAGLVAANGDGVLFGGPGGSGKSTTALTCLKAGFEYMADDYVGLRLREDGSYEGHSLFCSTHLDPDHLRRFPYLKGHAIPARLPREDKSLVLLSEVFDGGLSRKARVRAVALPKVVDAQDTSIRPATTIEALLRLAPSSLILLPFAGAAAQEFEKLSTFLETVPTYWLELGRDMDQIPLRIQDILEKHR
jgi:hypothetical protein